MNEWINPWFLAYSNLTGMLDVAKPGAIIVTGRGNRYDPAFQEARKRGAKVYTYWNVANVPENLSHPEDAAQYLIDGKPPPRWPFKTPDGKDRSQWPGTYLLDLRPGSAWLKHIVPTTGNVVDKNKFDGFFLDTLGARTWAKLADWGSWPVEEQSAWCAGCVNILREIKEEVNRRNPRIELVCNNLWDLPKDHPSDALAQTGDTHCNGVCMENPVGDVPGDYHKNYAGRPFGRTPRRVLIIDRTDADTILWASVQGVTHVCSVEKAAGETYARVTPPVVPYSGWPPSEVEQENAQLRERVAELTAQNAVLNDALEKSEAENATLLVDNNELKASLTEIHKLSSP